MPRKFLTLAFSLLAANLCAQTYTAKNVRFSDLGPYTQAQMEAAAGIRAGTTFTTAQLAAAAQQLANSGFLGDVSATVDGAIKAVTVKFTDQVLPTSAMLPVGFQNFVWLTLDEITAAIQAKLPLYRGYLPESSPHQEDVRTALAAALAAKSITAEVICDDFDPTLRHPHREIACSITKPRLRVIHIKLTGVTPALAPLIQKSVDRTSRKPYLEGPADVTTADSILEPLLDAGYIQAALTNPTPAPTTAPDGSVGVVLSATLVPGQIFHVASLDFAGTPVVSAATFAASAKLHPGDLASRKLLLATLLPIDQAYRNQGYLDVVVDANPKADLTALTVAYTVTVAPGEPYRVHQVIAQNLTGAAQADFDRGFLLKPGDVYNPSYLTGFLVNNTALRALLGYSASYKAYADPATHQVDLAIAFIKGTP